ncbi:hypothetical protein Q5425_35235 [Amycolatopsis sp. A133]|uniref:hypothetical protein n=1 Tax=Amycolatopsis sp. A133 TaxID=3064472 RepID=UPI0027F772EE|nr:hypothetical protein [Amycolatopsis sp. A133]MDQ7809014.1 hypothetical protein [Amycolatopsis sp. A133]
MRDLTIVRYQTCPEIAEENHQLIEQVMADLNDRDPGGLRYASFWLDDGVTFVHVVINDDDMDPLSRSAAFQALQVGLSERHIGGTRPCSAMSTATAARPRPANSAITSVQPHAPW